ncbi:MAG: phosphoribosylformylglycinamidine synthase [Deltaproteobacteria bacterium]|nr:MAG: phosphoribosylformylglycinamidine synthase [Deltaproteobacteria bacterium]
MAYRIEVGFKDNILDPIGDKIKKRIIRELKIPVKSVRTISVYTLDLSITLKQAKSAAKEIFLDPIIQDFSVNSPLAKDFDWLIEVGFKPGVTDNVGRTALESLSYFFEKEFSKDEKVYTSTEYLIKGDIDEDQVKRIAWDLLANSLIQDVVLLNKRSWDSKKGLSIRVPKVTSTQGGGVKEIDLEVSDEELIAFSQKNILALSLEEMKKIRDYLRRPDIKEKRRRYGLTSKITDVEIEAIAQTWSEHCKHKIFNARIIYEDENGKKEIIDGLFPTFIKGATKKIREELKDDDFCLSVFEDNAGVIAFNRDYSLVFKVETHNTPSALDPYGGALTGIVGVNRDPFGTGKGAKLIFNTDIFCFAPPDYNKELPPRIMHPLRIYEGVRMGVEHGGNKSGIPTINGCVVFDERYLGKPLVYCGTGGIMPRKINGEDSHIKKVEPGYIIVMTGGRIGKDGIHGATFSSEELKEESPTSAVQIGDPITQKKMTDFLLVARDMGLYQFITDNGAGGLSSSVGEMTRDTGCELHLNRAPLKYTGLDPWEILISEAQERMTLAVDPKKLAPLLELADKMGVEATPIGEVKSHNMFHILYNDKTVGLLDMDFLHNGVPRMELFAKWTPPYHEEPEFGEPKDLTAILFKLLSRYNICSKESIIRQYDHEVQGGSVIKPLVGKDMDGPSDGAIIRPILSSMEGVVVTNGICPKYGDIDTYNMALCALDEAVRNSVALGGRIDRMAALDNFCWPDPVTSEKNLDGAYKLAQLVRANKGLYDITTAYKIPLISGKDSMKNDYIMGDIKISVPPTLLFSLIAKIDDVRLSVSMDFKKPSDLIYLLGITKDETGGSEYFASLGYIGNKVPNVDPLMARKLYKTLNKAYDKRLINSCHDLSDGGLAVALAESSFAGGFGAEVYLKFVLTDKVLRDDIILFSESQSRFIVTISLEKRQKFEELFKNQPISLIGKVTEEPILKIYGRTFEEKIKADIFDLKNRWKEPLNF